MNNNNYIDLDNYYDNDNMFELDNNDMIQEQDNYMKEIDEDYNELRQSINSDIDEMINGDKTPTIGDVTAKYVDMVWHYGPGGILKAVASATGLDYDESMKNGKRLFGDIVGGVTGDPGMSEEEVQMYIVKCYGNSDLHEKMFDDPDKLNVSDIRKSDDLKTFRTNYRKILEFEKKTSDDPSLAEEIYAISRNLRTMLITGLGVRDENGKTIDKKDADPLKTFLSHDTLPVFLKS